MQYIKAGMLLTHYAPDLPAFLLRQPPPAGMLRSNLNIMCVYIHDRPIAI